MDHNSVCLNCFSQIILEIHACNTDIRIYFETYKERMCKKIFEYECTVESFDFTEASVLGKSKLISTTYASIYMVVRKAIRISKEIILFSLSLISSTWSYNLLFLQYDYLNYTITLSIV